MSYFNKLITFLLLQVALSIKNDPDIGVGMNLVKKYGKYIFFFSIITVNWIYLCMWLYHIVNVVLIIIVIVVLLSVLGIGGLGNVRIGR